LLAAPCPHEARISPRKAAIECPQTVNSHK
jgi:hypothetical protein